MKRLILPLALAVVGGCSSEIDELKAFVRDSEKGLTRRVEPLPAVKPFEPFAKPVPEGVFASRVEELRCASGAVMFVSKAYEQSLRKLCMDPLHIRNNPEKG